MTDEQLRRVLNSDIQLGQGAALSEEDLYLDLVRQTMYKVWAQPTSVSIDGLVTKVDISLQLDGSISERRLVRPSGNATMDASVMKAANSVSRIPGLPGSFIQKHRTITVAFELTGR